jgi:Dolichyl-phosphate-mannose-protein mannosyltransferase
VEPDTPQRTSRLHWIVLVIVMLLHVVAATWVNFSTSVAYDEYAHVAAGAAYVSQREGVLIYNLSPPVARWPAGVAARLSGASVPEVKRVEQIEPTSRHWVWADVFAKANADHYPSLIHYVRFSTLPISLTGIVLVFAIAGRFWGDWPATLAAAVVALEPGYLSHASLVGTDLPLVVAMLFAAWALFRYRESPTWMRASVLGGACLLMLGVKFSALAVMPVVLGMVIATHWKNKSLRLGFNHAAAVVLVGWLVVQIIYSTRYAGLDGWTVKHQFIPASSSVMQWVRSVWHPKLPMPVPYTLLEGFDAQSFEAQGKYHAMLFGQVYQGSSWMYWPAVVATKWPVGVLVLLGLMVWHWRHVRGAWVVTAMAGVFVVVIVLGTSINIGVRYLMPVVPLVVIVGVGLLSIEKIRRVVLVAALSIPLELATALPDPLGFYNLPSRLVGSSDSIVQDEDWSQGLVQLRRWMNVNQVDRVRLAYWGRVDPAIYGIAYDPIDSPESTTQYIVVSRLVMTGVPLRMQTAKDGPRSMQFPNRDRLLQIEPDFKLGSLWIWRADRVGGLI